MRSIGRGFLEGTCKNCGEIFVFSQGDKIAVRIDDALAAWPLCSQCAGNEADLLGDLIDYRTGNDSSGN